jgi:hypothetical protein
LTAWDTRGDQSFELGIAGNGGEYRYRLVVEHRADRTVNRIKTEQLQFDQKTLYEFDGQNAHLFRDDFSPGPEFPFDWSRSAIATVPERSDNKRLTWFRNRVEKLYVLSPDPLRMSARSETELARPDRPMRELVSWLRHLSQESPGVFQSLHECLKTGVIEGMQEMNLEKISSAARELKFEFDFVASGSSTRFRFSLDELSDGQRMLVALYAIRYAAVEEDSTVCIDEPDNFVALREIQPWLISLRDRVEDIGGQCLLISHHPECMNYLASRHGLLFYRDASGPIRTRDFQWEENDVISPAESVARGWE